MSTSQPRDADVDRLLRAVLKPAAGGTAGVCPDAEMLAAWAEGGLSPEERAGLETHFTGCGRCQETLAVIGAEPPMPRPAPERMGWFTWVTAPRLRWLVPITAAATVAVFFFATRPLIAPGDDAPAADATVQMARAEPSHGFEREGTPVDETTAAPMTRTAPEEKDAAAPPRPAAEVDTRMARREAGLADEAAPAEQVAAARPVSPMVSEPAPSAPVAPPAERAVRDKKEAAEGLGAATSGATSVLAPKAAVAADAPHPTTVALQEFATPRGGGARPSAVVPEKADARLDGEVGLLVAAPGGSVRWSFERDGRVRRSVDGGRSWQEQPFRVAADAAAGLNAGWAPSPDVCWIVGDAGTVLLTVDGETWQRRPFPLPADLVSVRAADARSAIVTARDGRRFGTRDGGLTWR